MAIDVFVMVMMVVMRRRVGLLLEPAGDIRRFGFGVVQAGAEQRVRIDRALRDRVNGRGGVYRA